MEFPHQSTNTNQNQASSVNMNGLLLLKTEPGHIPSGYLSPLPVHHASSMDPDFLPMSRARSNTWPLKRPEEPTNQQQHPDQHHDQILEEHGDQSNDPGSSLGLGFPKKPTSRRNAWGNLSYADLITQAINSAPDKRLTLSQIYDWMVANVAYFKDKGDSNSSAGWKNSIRHNLSLHNRFMRIQNEGTGKSSWWILNPEAKPGKASRRRATSMETSKFEKKRGRVKKKIEAMRNGNSVGLFGSPSPPHSSSLAEGLDAFGFSETSQPQHSPLVQHSSSSFYNLSPQQSDFRCRTSSNASSCGGGNPGNRLSPILGESLDFVQQIGNGENDTGSSLWDYNYSYSSPPHQQPDIRLFGPDQLAVGLQQSMKLGNCYGLETEPSSCSGGQANYEFGSSVNSGYGLTNSGSSSAVNHQSFSQFDQRVSPGTVPSSSNELMNGTDQSSYGQGANLNLGFQQSFHHYNPHQQQNHTTEGQQMLHDIKPNMTNTLLSSQQASELEFNLDLDPTEHPFECNVEEVLNSELSLGEGIDFNWGPSSASAMSVNQSSSNVGGSGGPNTSVSASSPGHGNGSNNSSNQGPPLRC